MKYLKLKGEIVLIDNILHVEMKENTIEILYGINVPEQGNKFYGHVLDYSEVKNDVNEEKTEVQKDYERIKKELIPEKENENKIKELENQIEMYKITLNNISSDISKYKQNLRNIVNSKEFSHKKIQKLKEVI